MPSIQPIARIVLLPALSLLVIAGDTLSRVESSNVSGASYMIKGFKDFLLRGNVVDLAVAVVIGAAFGVVVKAFSDDIIGGLIGAVGGSPDFAKASFKLNGSPVVYGPFLTAIVNFLIVAAVVYFFVVVPITALLERRKRGEESEVVATPEDVALLQEIRDLLRDRPMS